MAQSTTGSGSTTITVTLTVLVVLQSCLAQRWNELNELSGYYDDQRASSPQFGVRHPRSILQNLAVDRMLKDNGFVRSIINCVLDKGPCESNGRKLRLMAPEILRGQCPGCSRTVHTQIRRVISHVQRNFPVEWSEVTRRFMSYQNPPGGGMSGGMGGGGGGMPIQEYAPPPLPPQQMPAQQVVVPGYNPNDPNLYQQYG